MANLEQQFTADTARRIAASRKTMMKKDTEELSNKIVDYVNSVLSREVQKAIDADAYCSSIKIMLPKEYRKALLKLSSDEWVIIRDDIDRRLSKNGFSIKLQHNSWSCDSCLWRYMACTKYFNLYVTWNG